MNRKYLYKAISLVSGVVVISVVIFALFDRPVQLFSGRYQDLFARKKSENGQIMSRQSICDYQDTLEYYYYKESDPLWEQNNKFGLYIYAENKDYFEIAQNLVNSNGGDWGYVLIPYNVDTDRDYSKWERVFEQLRNKHLIPVIQLWAIDANDYKRQTSEAAEFLNSFIWPIKYRYVSAYNEPNDSKFWYGQADPEVYANVLDYTVNKFKEINPNFFILNGALNISAPSDMNHIDAFTFMKRMNIEVPGIFEKLDGWASHSYPQPNFSGNPHAIGRWSIRAYETELDYLKEVLGVAKELPVFITETGWAHAEGKNYNNQYPSVEEVSDNFKDAYQEIWLPDERVRAVMPFTIWYEPPFDHFSWVNVDNVPYKHYEEVKSLEKVTGNPPTLESATIPVGGCE